MSNTNKQSIITILPLFLVLFIDGMGLGLLFPILNALIVSPTSDFIAQGTPATVRNIYFGVTVGIFMLCWFFGSAILGDLSDHIGRKKSLMICLIGTFLGYLLSALAVIFNSLALIIIGRMIAGFTAGSQPIAQAAIVDISDEATLPRNMGWILLAVSLGFVLGPTLGGVLSNPQLFSWFNFATPLIFAAVIALINASLLWFTFHETFTTTEKIQIRLHHAIMLFVSAFRHVKIRYLSAIFLLVMVGWSMYFNTILIFMDDEYHLSNFAISLFMGCMGIGFSIGCGFLVNRLSAHFSLKQVAMSGFTLGGLTCFTALLIHSNLLIWTSVVIMGAVIGYGYSALLVLFSHLVDASEQGWVMGVTGSIMALCFGITAILGAFFANFHPSFPLFFSAACLFFGGCLILTAADHR